MFFKSASHTILLLTQEQLVRADFRGGALAGLWRSARPVGEELPSMIEAALQLTPARARRVWVLCSDVWTQMLSLAASTVQGLGDAELARALTFEAESLSGLSALDSETAFVPLGGEAGQRTFWIGQLPRWQRDQIDEIVRQAGGTLLGIAHPAAMPAAFTSATNGPGGQTGMSAPRDGVWRRVELWSNMVVGIEGSGAAGPARVHVLSTNPRSGTWQGSLDRWWSAEGALVAEEFLLEDPKFTTPAGPGEVLVLDSDAALETYLVRWSQCLAGKPAVPMLTMPRRPLSKQQRTAIAVALAAVVGAGVVIDRTTLLRKIDEANGATAAIKAKQAQLAAVKKQSDDLNKETDKKRKEVDKLRDDVKFTESTLQRYQLRHARLLALLSEYCPSDLIVESIEYDNGQMTLHGVCLGADASNRLASALGDELSEIGWQVQPPEKEAGALLVNDGEPWDFEVQLVDQLPGVVVPPAKMARPPAEEDEREPSSPRRWKLETKPGYRAAGNDGKS
ncbi:MAG TPA: hypothetical protein VHZ24_20580 [Pirellulales bacterium]|nr:hypothetical protein [Pirellulales bacterium]